MPTITTDSLVDDCLFIGLHDEADAYIARFGCGLGPSVCRIGLDWVGFTLK